MRSIEARIRTACIAVLAWGLVLSAVAAEHCLVLKENMEVLKCQEPDEKYHFAGSNAPGQLFLPGEPVNLKLVFVKGNDSGAVADFALEIQQITTRDPQRKTRSPEGFTDTSGNAPLLGLEGKPITHPLKVSFDDKPQLQFDAVNVPIPAKLGTYAVILTRGNTRQFLCTVARLPKPRADGTAENTPVLGDGSFFGPSEMYETRARQYARMGIRSFRSELSWSEGKDGKYDWRRYDAFFAALEANGIQAMVTLGGHPWHFLPFGEPCPAAGYTNTPYGGCADWLCDPKLYPRYGEWITAFCQRYWKDGKGGLWALEHYNEPWEGGGISGWARDCLEYRKLLKLIAESAWKVDRKIKVAAASSVMNTEDKFYSDGSKEFDQYIDIFTDHYVQPAMCYGPLVAKAHGKVSMETETWFVGSEYLLPQAEAQFMACGQLRLAPWHPRVLFDKLPGVKDDYLIPTPLVAATAAFNSFVTGKTFEKVVFQDHLPWVFQYGADSDKDALLVLFGQLITVGGDEPKARCWAQVEGAAGGAMTIANRDGLLEFYDLAGNRVYEGQAAITLPMTIFPSYIKCAKGPLAAAERLKLAKIEGKRPVEILPRDFTRPLTPQGGAALNVVLHNCLNRALAGKLTAKPPAGIALRAAEQTVELAAGERKTCAFEIVSTQSLSGNAYPFVFSFTSDAGNAEYQEELSVVVARKGSKKIDGNLEEWSDVPGVVAVAKAQKAEVSESLRRPWLELKDKQPDGSFAEVKLAWDEEFLYVCARVNDKTPQTGKPRQEGLDPNSFFHTAADDTLPHYKEFLQKHAGHSFGEVPYVYARNPEPPLGFRGDRLQIGLDVTPDWHDLTPDTSRVPYGFHAVPDTDYEYSVYLCADGKSECWRLLAPGVPRRHDFPRQPSGQRSTGVVPGVKHVVKQDGTTRIYQLALPRAELSGLKLQSGTTFGFTFLVGNDNGPQILYGADKAVCKINGLTLHPYWELKPSCGVIWVLGE